jgi:hypothetical protein
MENSNSTPVDTLVEDSLNTTLLVFSLVNPRTHYIRSGKVEKGESRPTGLPWGDGGSSPCTEDSSMTRSRNSFIITDKTRPNRGGDTVRVMRPTLFL